MIRRHRFTCLIQSILFAVIGSLGIAQVALADAAPAAGEQPGFGQMVIPFILMFGVVWFLMIRPQQTRMKEQKNMLAQLKEGDEVITSSGILGTVTSMTDKVVTLEVADKVRIKMLKSQISQVVKGNLKDVAV